MKKFDIQQVIAFILVWIVHFTGHTQQDDLSQDTLFFENQEIEYQRWLDSTGLGTVLRLDTSRVLHGNLELFLCIDTDSILVAAMQWKQLEDTMRAAGFVDLKEELFRQFIHKMDIPAALGNIQIRVCNQLNQTYHPQFYVGIWEENGALQDSVKIPPVPFYKSKTFTLNIPPVKVKKVSRRTSSSVHKIVAPSAVFNNILDFTQQQLLKPKCDNREPRIEMEDGPDDGNYQLKFTVTDLCKVVLIDEQKSIWCRILENLGGDCNDMRRERLTFTFTYTHLPGGKGYELKCRIDGKFGIGPFRPRAGGYMDMEPDFNDYLDSFTILFKNELERYLRRK